MCFEKQIIDGKNYHGLNFGIYVDDCGFIGINTHEHVWISDLASPQHQEEIFTVVPVFPGPSYAPPRIDLSFSPGGDIIFSVSRISEIIRQKSEWEGRQIHYRIGLIDYAHRDGSELNDLACHHIPLPLPDVKIDREDFPKFGLECTSPSP